LDSRRRSGSDESLRALEALLEGVEGDRGVEAVLDALVEGVSEAYDAPAALPLPQLSDGHEDAAAAVLPEMVVRRIEPVGGLQEAHSDAADGGG